MPILVNQDQYPQELALHQKYAKCPLLLELVWTHSNIIAQIVIQLFNRHTFDTSGVSLPYAVQAALVADIGVYECNGFEWLPGQPMSDRPYIQHSVVGAWILQNEGYHPEVIQVAHTHTGVGITQEDIAKYGLDLPAADYRPKSLLQQFVSYAAKFHSKSPMFKTVADIRQNLDRYGADKVAVFDQWLSYFGEPDLSVLISEYQDWHQSFHFRVQQLVADTTRSQGLTANVSLNSAGLAI